MTFSRFDTVVWGVALFLLGLVALVIFMGNQISLEILSFTPALDASAVSTQSQIRVTFDDDLASVPETAVSFSPPISGTTTFNNNTLTFIPDTPFNANEQYQVTINAGIAGEQGRELKEAVSWVFETSLPRILYLRVDEDNPNQIFVAYPDGDIPPHPLTQQTTNVIDFKPSPDSSMVIYSAAGEDAAQPTSADLWLINSDGTDPQMVLACPDAACTRPIWLGDNERILYERRNIPVPGAAPGNPRLWLLDVTTGESLPLFQDSQLIGLFATLSPDGQWLSYVAPTEQGIQLYNLENGRSIFIPNRMSLAAHWSPDSQQVAVADIVTTEEDWGVVLSSLDINTEKSTLLSQGENIDDNYPIWSPDGEQIAFGRKEARTAMGRQIWVMDADGSAATPLTGETKIHHADYSWSPNGRFILFQQYNLEELYTQPNIALIDVQTGEKTEIASPATQPAWLP